MTMNEFIASAFITCIVQPVDRNPHMDDSDRMDHWKVRFTRPGRSMTTYFSMGSGHNGRQPDTGEVLECLASDAAGIENARNFDDWCAEYGYDTDSRKAHRTYTICQREASKLKRFLDAGYERLLFEVNDEQAAA